MKERRAGDSKRYPPLGAMKTELQGIERENFSNKPSKDGRKNLPSKKFLTESSVERRAWHKAFPYDRAVLD